MMRNKLNEVKEFDIISICDTIRIAMFDEPYPYIDVYKRQKVSGKSLTVR